MTNSGQTYNIHYANRVKRDLKKIDKQFLPKIKAAIDTNLINDPYGNSQGVKDKNLPSRKLRVGDYRILFDIDDQA